MHERDFVGTWRLVSMEARSADGAVRYPFGEAPRGFIMYAPDGYMSVVIFAAGRKHFGTSDRLVGTDEQFAAAARTYISYAGRYEVRGEHVRHSVEASLFPDWVGSIQERRYTFAGSRLTLATDPMPLGGMDVTVVLVWERTSSSPTAAVADVERPG